MAPPLTQSRDAGLCCATKHNITATQAQAGNDIGTKRRTVTWWDDKHDGQEEAMHNEEKAPHSQLGRSSNASQPAPSAETSTKPKSCAPDTVQRIQRPNTTWFKVVGALPMPWFECTHPLCIVDITMRATPGCIQQANGGPFCQLRVISGATTGWLCQAHLASFQVDAQIVLQRNIRAVGGTGRTRPDKYKDMLRDLDDLEHRQTQPKRAKDTDPEYLYDAALAKFKIICSNPPHENKTAMTNVTHNRQRRYDTIRTRWNKDHEQPSKQSGNHAADTFARTSAMQGPGCAMSVTHNEGPSPAPYSQSARQAASTLSPHVIGCTATQIGGTPAAPVAQTGPVTASSSGNATWIKVTGAMPMDWTPLTRPFGIADIT